MNWHIPLVYILTTNRKESTYAEIFAKLLEIEPHIKPARAMIDFELAAINAINMMFEGITVSGCFFHLEKNMWRHVQQFGLQTRYNNDSEFAVNLRMLAALAFVPVVDVIRAYEAIVSSDFWSDDATKDANSEKQMFLNYFEKYYIGVMGRTQSHGRKKSRFPIELWNMYDLTV